MDSQLLSRRDLDFLLYEWLDVESLTNRCRFTQHSRDTFDALLDVCEQVATERFANHLKISDANEPRLEGGHVVLPPEIQRGVDAFAALGLIGAVADEHVGGLQLPATVAAACWAWFHAANAATTAYPMLTAAAANLLTAYGTTGLIESFARPMIEGRFFGTMCLSEPHAGSSLVDITTRAVPADDGTYRISGNKMWISGGDHQLSENIVHMVLAKIPGGPPGIKGISLFVVPKYLVDDDGGVSTQRNDVALAGLNHKMGYRGTVNTVLSFGDGSFVVDGTPGAVGHLVGEPHHGLRYMFHMMNEARLSIGLAATASGYTGYLKSLDYAKLRTQGRSLDGKDPDAAPVAIIDHPDVRRMLLAQKSYVEGALALNLYCARLVDEQKTANDEASRLDANLMLEVLTPIAKSWPAQWCLAANDLAIQVLGGAGYTRDYDVEQHYRDNRLNAIHEGTHGIQAIDLLSRKVRMEGGRGLDLVISAIRATTETACASGGRAAELAVDLDRFVQRLVCTTRDVWATDDPKRVVPMATPYLETAGHIVVAWIWLEQYLACGDRDSSLHTGKRSATEFFFRYELPKVDHLLDLVSSLDSSATEIPNEAF